MTCAVPSGGIFGFLGSPVFSDAEDNNICGNPSIAQFQTCWMGALRNHVQGNVFTAHNTMADPDANEVLANHVPAPSGPADADLRQGLTTYPNELRATPSGVARPRLAGNGHVAQGSRNPFRSRSPAGAVTPCGTIDAW